MNSVLTSESIPSSLPNDPRAPTRGSPTQEAPYNWQAEEAFNRIEAHVADSASAALVYVGCTRLANAERSPAFETTGSCLARRSFVSRTTVWRRLADLQRIGVLRVTTLKMPRSREYDRYRIELLAVHKVVSPGRNLVARCTNVVSGWHNLVSRCCKVVSWWSNVVSRCTTVVSRWHEVVSRWRKVVSRWRSTAIEEEKKDSTHTPGAGETERPSWEEVRAYAGQIGLAGWKARDWWEEMEGCGWLDYRHRLIRNWRAVLNRVRTKWEADGRPAQPPSRPGAVEARAVTASPVREAASRAFTLKTQLEAVEAGLEQIRARGTPDAFGTRLAPADRDRFRELQAKKKEIQAALQGLT